MLNYLFKTLKLLVSSLSRNLQYCVASTHDDSTQYQSVKVLNKRISVRTRKQGPGGGGGGGGVG